MMNMQSIKKITFTKSAISHIKNLTFKSNDFLKVSIKKQGCAGSKYIIEFVRSLKNNDIFL